MRVTYTRTMRQSSVITPTATIDVAANARSEMARQRLGASDLVSHYGGSHSYWSRRLTGVNPMSVSDIESIAALLRIHAAQLMGGQAPEGWTPEPIGITVTRQSLSSHTAPVVATGCLPIQRLRSVDFIPSQQAA